VTVTLRGDRGSYDGLRAARVEDVLEHAHAVACRFGDDRFVELCESGFDVVCHHGADVTNYKSLDFDAVAALASNTHNLPRVAAALGAAGSALVLTGSVFEPDEGQGEPGDGLPAFSPYGLSKALTAHAFRYWCELENVPFGKFVIPNPFGPLEEPRFTAYLVGRWMAAETPRVGTPAYVRDNIHVDLLALAYAAFAEHVAAEAPRYAHHAPTGYRETQGAFAHRFAAELAPRLGIPCPLELAEQTEFAEPRVRLNVDPVDAVALGWDEHRAWDAIAEWYGARARAAV
jgi:nucleoside-diphosphate-sugar epimerase